MNQQRVAAALRRGISYIASVQRPDGGFDSFSSPAQQPFQPELTYRTTFTPALILGALADIAEAAPVRTAAAAWLLAQKGEYWSFNYWAADAPERAVIPYPDDLDDTFCALSSLYRHDPHCINAGALGVIVRLLLAAETRVGGPYRTWLVPRTAGVAWQDVDVAVNSNVAYFLRLAARPLPNLSTYMERAISSKALMSPYYPTVYPLWYYLARAYDGPLRARLRSAIIQRRRHGHWGTPLHTALSVCALHYCSGPPQPEAITYLLAQQNDDGSWPAEAFCADPARNGAPYVGGAAALTTALVLEALHSTRAPKARPAAANTHQDREARTLYDTALAQAARDLAAWPPALGKPGAAELARMQRNPYTREIILLPLFFARSLKNKTLPPQRHLVRLGLANLYGWLAYIIYDDLLDNSGDTRLLPVANAAQRLSLARFVEGLPRRSTFRALVYEVFDRIDAANAWEATNCRFVVHGGMLAIGHIPKFGTLAQLAERSLGHALPALGILAATGIPPEDPRARKLLESLKQYLIARQLGDDLRDWEADLHAGTCSYVVAALLNGCGIAPGDYALDGLLPRLRHEFAQRTLADVSHAILRHAKLARRALAQSGLVTTHSPVSQLLDDIEALAQKQLNEHANAQTFLDAFGKKPPAQ